MNLEISNPTDYHAALYIRLSKEDENEGPSESVTNQKSLLNEFVKQYGLSVYDTYIEIIILILIQRIEKLKSMPLRCNSPLAV